MKQLLFISILLLNVSFIYSQNVVVASERYNVALVGVGNPLSIAVGNVPTKLLVVKAKNGIVEGSEGKYMYIPKRTGLEEITVYKKNNEKLILLGKYPIRVQPFPKPTAFVGSQNEGTITKKTFLAMGGLIAKYLNTDFEANASVDSFQVCIIYRDSCVYRPILNVGNRWNKDVMAALQSLRINDAVLIKDIHVTQPTLESVELDPIYFTIVDN